MRNKFLSGFMLGIFILISSTGSLSAAEDSYVYDSGYIVSGNAIQWFEWGDNAFELANKEKKPIFLYLTSSWCHWCHVMENETFTDPEVIRMINQMFVPIKVDTDLRPDINERYNAGGWPSSLFLTSEGNILVAATFLSATQMKQALPEMERLFSEKSKEFNQKAVKERAEFDMMLKRELEAAKEEDLAPSFIDKIVANIVLNADDEFGGIGKADKYPLPEVTEFLFLIEEVRPDEKARKVLNAFLAGEAKLFDSEMGGFFRYSENRDWTKLQYEKMLSNNAMLMRDFSWSQVILDRPGDEGMVQLSLEYLEENLWDKALGGFFGSQSADFFLVTSGLDKRQETAIIPGSVYYSYPKEKRLELGNPPVDRHVYTDSCSQMIYTLLEISRKKGDQQWGQRALKAMDFLMQVSFEPERGMKHSFPEPERSSMMLSDQAWTLRALLGAYEYSGDEKYQDWINQLLMVTEKNLSTGKGIFYDQAPESQTGNLKRREVPLIENCLMARFYIKWSTISGKEIYREKARSILYFFAPRYQQFSVYSAAFGSALIDWFYPSLDVKVMGGGKDPKAQVLWNEVRKLPSNRLNAGWQEPQEGKAPQVLICVGKKCLTPAESADKIPVLFELAQKMIQKSV